LPAIVAVNVVIAGTVFALILNVLVEVALIKLVIVPELMRFTIPPALFVIPVMVPDPLRFSVPVFVKLATAVVVVPVPVRYTVPVLVKVVIEQVPPMLRVPVAEFSIPPVPESPVPTVRSPLLVNVIPVTLILGIEIIPFKA
jgi:hypothetical protein